MPNTYYKILNNTVKKKYNENLIGDIQRDLSRSVKMMSPKPDHPPLLKVWPA